jgi:PAS domain S-box-containing protein
MDLYDFSPAGHLTLDLHGKIVECNYRAAILLGMNRPNMIGERLASFIHRDDQAAFQRHCRTTIATGVRQQCEARLHQEGKTAACYVNLESLAFRDDRGTFSRWRTAMLDISDRKYVERELETQKRQLEAIVGSAMDAIVTVDQQHRVVLFNQAAEAMFGCSADEAMDRPLDRFIPPRLRQAHHKHLEIFASAPASSPAHKKVSSLIGLRATGEEFPLEGCLSRVIVDGRALFTVILRDISERRAAEQALRTSDAFTGAVLDSLSAHVCVVDKDGVILKVNEAWKDFARNNAQGVVAQADVGDNYLALCRRAIAAGDRALHPIVIGIESVLARSQPTFATEYACHSPDEQRWFLMRVTRLLSADAVVIWHMDISERVGMARALEDHVVLLAKQQAELENLAGKLIEAQERERRRIARELHDDFNQRLAALSLELETIEQAAGAPSDPAMKQLSAIRDHIGRLSDDLHDLAYRLHPSLLEHVGLEVAARDHVDEFVKRTGLFVEFTARAVPEKLPLEAATNLFRIMQESLQNVSKHAAATTVIVGLSGSPKGIGLSVCDDGQGFDPNNTSLHVKGLGFLSMQERVRLLGGFLHIRSFPVEGTKVCAWIPLAEEGA